jgi:hypothetical protein
MSETNERLQRVELQLQSATKSLDFLTIAQREAAAALSTVAGQKEQIDKLTVVTDSLVRGHARIDARVDGLFNNLSPLLKLPEQVAVNTAITKAAAWLAGAVVVALLSVFVALVTR